MVIAIAHQSTGTTSNHAWQLEPHIVSPRLSRAASSSASVLCHRRVMHVAHTRHIKTASVLLEGARGMLS
jgi:hypothetical protein